MNGEIRVTKLERDPAAGFWRARVSVNGRTVRVDRRWGSWQAEVRTAAGARTFVRRDVLAPVAAELQRRVRPIEARERREREAALKAQAKEGKR